MTSPSTRSPQINRLIARCLEWLSGAADLSTLQTTAAESKTVMQKARAQFVEECQDPNHPLAAAVKTKYDALVQACEMVGAAERTQAAIDGLIAQLEKAVDGLFWATQEYYTQFPPGGPTDSPVLNAVLRLVESARTNPALAPRVAEEAMAARTTLDKLLEQSADDTSKATSQARTGWKRCIEGLEELQKFHLDEGTKIIIEAAADLSAASDTYARENFSAPTSSQLINTYIAAASRLKNGQYSPNVFAADLVALDKFIADGIDEYELQAYAFRDSAPLSAQFIRMQDGLRMQQQASTSYRSYLLDGGSAALDEGNRLMIESARLLDEAGAALQTLQQQGEGQMMCPRCSAPNDPHNRFCTSCNAALPKISQEAEAASYGFHEDGDRDVAEQPVLTENMKRLIDDTDAVAANRMSTSDYQATLDWLAAKLDKAQAEMPSIAAEEGTDPAVAAQWAVARETCQLYGGGIDHMREGLSVLRAFLQDGDRKHLVDGLRIAWEGSQQIYRAGHVGQMIVAHLPAEEEEAVLHQTAESSEEPPTDNGSVA